MTGGVLQGSCACGRVRYEVRGELVGPITFCHCWRCRKHSGSSFGTTAGVRAADLVFLLGEDRLSSWESSRGIERFFAGCCGSPIFKRDANTPGLLGFRLGTLDSDPGRSAEMHFEVGSKVPWLDIHDTLPRRGDGPRVGQRDLPSGS